MDSQSDAGDYRELALSIKRWAAEIGFQDVRITDTSLQASERHLERWLALGRHGEMEYMARHGSLRTRPGELVPGTLRVISVRLDYLPQPQGEIDAALLRNSIGYISRYALGRDYHKLMRKRLQRLAVRIESEVGPYVYRAFVDSAPVMEKPLAQKSGIGWIGKHTNIINKGAGSWFFLGELYTSLPLPVDDGASNHCGSCRACIDICPTDAIVAPYELDARRCISYLTIELRGPIPEPLRSLVGNRIYGCDDCQLVCPWNRYARLTREPDFLPRAALKDQSLTALARWSEHDFLSRTEGSAIRRIGYECWLRNIAVALGNADTGLDVVAALEQLARSKSELVREHADWGLKQHRERQSTGMPARL